MTDQSSHNEHDSPRHDSDVRDGKTALWQVGREVAGFVPFIGDIVRVAEVSSSVRDILFQKKVERLLRGLGKAQDREREAWHIDQDPDYANRVGVFVMLQLDKYEDMEKADLLATALRAHLCKRLSFEQLRQAAHAIGTCFPVDLLRLHQFQKLRTGSQEGVQYPQLRLGSSEGSRLSGAGLVEPWVLGGGGTLGPGNNLAQYRLTSTGQMMLDNVLGESP